MSSRGCQNVLNMLPCKCYMLNALTPQHRQVNLQCSCFASSIKSVPLTTKKYKLIGTFRFFTIKNTCRTFNKIHKYQLIQQETEATIVLQRAFHLTINTKKTPKKETTSYVSEENKVVLILHMENSSSFSHLFANLAFSFIHMPVLSAKLVDKHFL